MRRPLTFLALLATLATVAALAAVSLTGPSASASVSRQPTGVSTKSAAKPDTKYVYVRPVTVSGKPAAGWSVTRESGSVSCYGTAPAAVNPGITSCYPTAVQLSTCFRSARHTVLCVRDARVKELVRMRYSGTYPKVQALQEPQPLNLVLADGRGCTQRFGGAYSSPAQHPQWFAFDNCDRTAGIYGGGNGDGINRTHSAWTVKVWRNGVDPAGKHLVTRAVTTVYYVGTAADAA